MEAFARHRAETLNPKNFDCGACDSPWKDFNARPVQCPKCELMSVEQENVSQIIPLTLRYYGAWPKGVTVDELLRVYSEVSALVGRRKTVRAKWGVRLARLARIYLGEQNHARAVESFDSLQRMRQLSQQSHGGVKYTQISRGRYAE